MHPVLAGTNMAHHCSDLWHTPIRCVIELLHGGLVVQEGEILVSRQQRLECHNYKVR